MTSFFQWKISCIVWSVQVRNEKGFESREWKIIFVVSQVTIKASLIIRGEAYPVLRLNDPVEAVRPTRELEGEFHNCHELLCSHKQLRAIISRYCAFVILSNVVRACVIFLIALFPFESISYKTRRENRGQCAGKQKKKRPPDRYDA